MFKRGRATAPAAVPQVDWRGVTAFEVGTTVLRKRRGRRKPVTGRLAVRVPTGDPDDPVLAPCAYFAPHVAASVAASRLYTDEDAQHVLLRIGPRQRDGEDELRTITDADGGEIGVIRRVPPEHHLVRHTWVLSQPGRPDITGKTVGVGRRGGRMQRDLISGLRGLDGGENAHLARTIMWHARDELVMTTRAFGVTVISADWLDRRLAFAYAMLADR